MTSNDPITAILDQLAAHPEQISRLTRSGGLHAYFTGSNQRNGHLPAHHLDFRSRGGYVLTPPSQIDGKPYQLMSSFRRRRPAGFP
jgi:hypothetical protein